MYRVLVGSRRQVHAPYPCMACCSAKAAEPETVLVPTDEADGKFTITLLGKYEHEEWGVDLAMGYPPSLNVLNLRPGAITRYNEENPKNQIVPGDWIFQVNDATEPFEMRDTFLRSNILNLIVAKSWYIGRLDRERHKEKRKGLFKDIAEAGSASVDTRDDKTESTTASSRTPEDSGPIFLQTMVTEQTMVQEPFHPDFSGTWKVTTVTGNLDKYLANKGTPETKSEALPVDQEVVVKQNGSYFHCNSLFPGLKGLTIGNEDYEERETPSGPKLFRAKWEDKEGRSLVIQVTDSGRSFLDTHRWTLTSSEDRISRLECGGAEVTLYWRSVAPTGVLWV